MELDLWLCGRLVARTESRERGARVRIVYDGAIAAEVGDEVPLLSCSLPTPGPSTPARARSFLEGLLPEGRALEAAAAQVRGVRLSGDAPETPSDSVILLSEFGRECAGAVVAVPAGSPGPGDGEYKPLDEEDLAAIVRGLPQHPLGADLDRDVRMSLAGAQPKFLLARIADRWCEPVGGAPSTHIFKPTTPAWPHSARNEALVMTLARSVGLTEHPVWVENVDGAEILVVERYDRAIRAGEVVRLHQEDMCQAVGLRPVDKYDIGRPSKRMARLLREFTADPSGQAERLFRQLAFRVVVGDEDGHGKNYSVLLRDGAVTLAPLYDSLCTLLYPELSGRMAAPVGVQESLAKVDRAALLDEAAAMGIPRSEAEGCLDRLGEGLRRGIDELEAGLTAGWPSERVVEIIRTRIDRLEASQPLGRSSGRRTSRRLTLDEATRRAPRSRAE